MNNNDAANNGNRNGDGNRRGNVRGPTSALTSFLREHGISVPNRNRRARRLERERAGGEEATATTQVEVTEATSAVTENAEATSSTAAAQTESILYTPSRRSAGTSKRKSKKRGRKGGDNGDDSDYQDSDDDFAPSTSRKAVAGRARIVFCSNCKGRFARKETDSADNTICSECKAGPSTAKKPVKRRKAIPAVQKQNYSKELVPSLQDICIAVVADYIDDVEALGFIGEESFEKLAKIISRNRKLNDATSKLFMEAHRRRLELYDCTNMSDNAFFMISQFCHRLEHLKLAYCGRITDKSIEAYQARLPNLRSLEVSGPMLVTKGAWVSFFEAVGPRLENFAIRDSARFTRECIESMSTHCINLKKLRLVRITHASSDWLPLISKFKKLDTLELSWVSKPYTLETADVISMLTEIGPQLEELSIKGGYDLTDEVLSEGILQNCHRLKRLSLERCEQLTADAMVNLMDNWKTKGLAHLDISRCILFNDEVLKAVIRNSGEKLEQLNLNGLELLTPSGLEMIAGDGKKLNTCESLKHLDCGFVRSMDDFVLKKLMEHCKSLSYVQVAGCHLLTENAGNKFGLRISGLEMAPVK